MTDFRHPDSWTAARRLLRGILVLGVVGMGTELVLIGHVDGLLQLVPLVLLGAGLVVLIWHAVAPTGPTTRALQAMMVAFVVSGLGGVGLHYYGNREFELEMYPAMAGFELIRETLSGATPVLAPGSMALLGLTGLLVARRDPMSNQVAPQTTEKDVSAVARPR